MVQRERDALIAQTDMMVGALMVLIGIPEKVYAVKREALSKRRQRFLDVVYQDAYDLSKKRAETDPDAVDTGALLQKVANLGK